MSIQFQSQFLLEEYDEQLEFYKDALLQAGASEDAAIMLATAVKNTPLELPKAIEIVKSTTGLSEDGMGGSMTGGGTMNGSSFETGIGMQYTTRKDEDKDATVKFEVGQEVQYNGNTWKILSKNDEGPNLTYRIEQQPAPGIQVRVIHDALVRANPPKAVEEDAPMLAHGKADISTYTNDGFKKTKRGTSGMTGVIPKNMWGTEPTAMSGEVDETWDFNTGGIKAWDVGKILPEDMEDALKAIVSNPGVSEKDLAGIRARAKELYKDSRLTRNELNFYMNTSLEDFKEMFLESTAGLQESRGYGQFKREAATRTKAQQMHEAAKMINNKLDEINKLLEYTNQMRSDLSEGEEQLEYKHNTKALFEKMNKKVVEAYTKLKKVK